MGTSPERIIRIAATAAALLLPTVAAAQPSLCTADEPVVFSCRAGQRLVSLCRTSPAGKALVFRFGTAQALEVVYPDAASALPGKFTVSQAPLVGGGKTAVVFRWEWTEYRVFSQVSRGSDDGPSGQRFPVFEDGLEMRRAGRRPTRLVCDDGGEGFRESVDWLPEEAP